MAQSASGASAQAEVNAYGTINAPIVNMMAITFNSRSMGGI